MATGLIELIKIAAMEAIENGKPCDLRFGDVVSISPLKVRITSDFILPESLLVVSKHLTDYSTNANIGLGGTSGGGGSGFDISVIDDTLYIKSAVATVSDDGVSEFETEGVDERTLTVYNGLEVGDNVVLLRNQGGTKYLILDRV